MLHFLSGLELLMMHVMTHAAEVYTYIVSPFYLFFLLFIHFIYNIVCLVDYSFIVISRQTFLEMGIRSGVVEERFWPGYKERYYELSEERKISTLKVCSSIYPKKNVYKL
jgi:type IV secretory pathway VirB3-like protein